MMRWSASGGKGKPEIDERWVKDFVSIGIDQIYAMLKRHAQYVQACVKSNVEPY